MHDLFEKIHNNSNNRKRKRDYEATKNLGIINPLSASKRITPKLPLVQHQPQTMTRPDAYPEQPKHHLQLWMKIQSWKGSKYNKSTITFFFEKKKKKRSAKGLSTISSSIHVLLCHIIWTFKTPNNLQVQKKVLAKSVFMNV